MGDVGEGINREEHFKKARELFYSLPFPEKQKYLVGLMEGFGNELKVVCEGDYQNVLHQKNASLSEGIIYESLGIEIKRNLWGLNGN